MRATTLTRLFLLLLALALSGCAHLTSDKRHHSSSLMDYLYPGDEKRVEPALPTLHLPLRVGIAFVPTSSRGSISSTLEKQLLDQVREQFIGYDYIDHIEVIPSAYLRPRGSFDNLKQLQSMFGIDVVALVSFDQMQFTDEDALAFSYWTIVGAYLVSGEKNETHTLLDTAVFDIDSRKLLFRAPGSSRVEARATPVNYERVLRENAEEGLKLAATEMATNLKGEVTRFEERVKKAQQAEKEAAPGSVPTEKAPAKIEYRQGYSGGGGALDWWWLALGLVVVRRRLLGVR